MPKFTFMGTGAGCGVPAFFCDCIACQEARANPIARRGDCGVMVSNNYHVLIDTPPDIRQYLIRENIRKINHVLYTHAHYDHVSGLGELEYMSRLITKRQIPIYASPEALTGINTEFNYLSDCLDTHALEDGQQILIDDISYTALKVSHAPGTFGYLIENTRDAHSKKIFYASDTTRLPQKTAERIQDIDVAILDATFWKSNWSPQAHNTVDEVIEEAFGLNIQTLYLTHLAMHYAEPITLQELEEYVHQYGDRVKIPYDGLSFEF